MPAGYFPFLVYGDQAKEVKWVAAEIEPKSSGSFPFSGIEYSSIDPPRDGSDAFDPEFYSRQDGPVSFASIHARHDAIQNKKATERTFLEARATRPGYCLIGHHSVWAVLSTISVIFVFMMVTTDCCSTDRLAWRGGRRSARTGVDLRIRTAPNA